MREKAQLWATVLFLAFEGYYWSFFSVNRELSISQLHYTPKMVHNVYLALFWRLKFDF